MNKEKPLIQATLGDLHSLINELVGDKHEAPKEEVKVKRKYVYGLQGLCDLLSCSTSTAARIKRSGVIDAAISQHGKIIVVDADLAIDLLNIRKRRIGNNRKF